MVDKYMKAFKEVTENAVAASGTREQLEAALADINQQLKGPLSNTERLLLVGDRADIRKALKEAERG